MRERGKEGEREREGERQRGKEKERERKQRERPREQWRSQRGQGSHAHNQFRNIWMVVDGGPIIATLIHRATQYRRYKDACARFSIPVLPFRKEMFRHANRNKLDIFHICSWLQPKR